MKLETVITNLRNTIAGKEQYLAECNKALNVQLDPLDASERMAITATAEFLEINIGELNRILADVEQCRPEWNVYNCPYTETCHRID